MTVQMNHRHISKIAKLLSGGSMAHTKALELFAKGAGFSTTAAMMAEAKKKQPAELRRVQDHPPLTLPGDPVYAEISTSDKAFFCVIDIRPWLQRITDEVLEKLAKDKFANGRASDEAYYFMVGKSSELSRIEDHILSENVHFSVSMEEDDVISWVAVNRPELRDKILELNRNGHVSIEESWVATWPGHSKTHDLLIEIRPANTGPQKDDDQIVGKYFVRLVSDFFFSQEHARECGIIVIGEKFPNFRQVAYRQKSGRGPAYRILVRLHQGDGRPLEGVKDLGTIETGKLRFWPVDLGYPHF